MKAKSPLDELKRRYATIPKKKNCEKLEDGIFYRLNFLPTTMRLLQIRNLYAA